MRKLGKIADRLLSKVVPTIEAQAGTCSWTTSGCGTTGHHRNCCTPTGGSTCCGTCRPI